VTVHVDELGASMWAPGQAYLEYRIFLDGALVGRGGRSGCSLGAGGNDLPARALLPSGEVLVVKEGGLVGHGYDRFLG
jgi:hypothetical protein